MYKITDQTIEDMITLIKGSSELKNLIEKEFIEISSFSYLFWLEIIISNISKLKWKTYPKKDIFINEIQDVLKDISFCDRIVSIISEGL